MLTPIILGFGTKLVDSSSLVTVNSIARKFFNIDYALYLPHENWVEFRSEMTLNYCMIVAKYPFPNGVVDDSIPTVKSSLCLTEKITKHVGSQEPTHRK